jgi:hypothetical protein
LFASSLTRFLERSGQSEFDHQQQVRQMDLGLLLVLERRHLGFDVRRELAARRVERAGVRGSQFAEFAVSELVPDLRDLAERPAKHGWHEVERERERDTCLERCGAQFLRKPVVERLVKRLGQGLFDLREPEDRQAERISIPLVLEEDLHARRLHAGTLHPSLEASVSPTADEATLSRVSSHAVTVTFQEGREQIPLPIDLPVDATRLVLADSTGKEHHFGCGHWNRNGEFVHVASYSGEGREKIYWFDEILDALKLGWHVVEDPKLGPRLPPLVTIGLEDMARGANKVNGFIGYEKELAVRVLRALWNEAREPLDPDEIEIWAATNGWTIKQASGLREIAEGVREGRRFRSIGGGRAISQDNQREAAMVAQWREQLDGDQSE